MSQVIINDVPPYTQASASAGQTVFGTNWTANFASDVIVYVTPVGFSPNDATQILSYPSQYSVSFVGALQQVQVTLVTPRALGDIVTITRMTPADRENLYTNTNFVPTMLNNDFGILTLVDQEDVLVNQSISPRYNYSATIISIVDTILPILGPDQIWVKNSANTAIIAVDRSSGGGGSGTVDTGLINELAWYAASGTTVNGLPTIPNGVLVTSAGGVPSISTTLPTGLTIPGFANAPVNTNITSMTGLTGYLQFPLGIKDANGNIVVGFVTAGAASVNYINIINGLTGGHPGISATGSDANVQLFLASKGGVIQFADNANTVAAETRYYNAGNAFYVGLKAPVLGASLTFALPASDGTAGQFLSTDGSGNLSFVSATGSGTVNSGLINQLAWYAASGTTVSGLATANNGVLVTSGAGIPSISTTLPSGLTIPGYQTTITPAALTDVDDTNVTLTLGGTPATALLQAVSITVGWTGTLSLTRGGTAASLTASNGGIVYSTGTALAILPGTATAGQILRSGSNTSPNWSLATYPSTSGTIGNILTSDGTNWISSPVATPVLTDSHIFVGNASNVATDVAMSGDATIANTGALSLTPIIAGGTFGDSSNVPQVTVDTKGRITAISNVAISGGIAVNNVTGTSAVMAADNLYVTNNAALVTLTLPATIAVGRRLLIRGSGAGGWAIAQPAGVTIHFGTFNTTTGVTGGLSSSNRYDCLELTCIIADTDYVISAVQGNPNWT